MSAAPPPARPRHVPGPGERVGPWQLVRELGRGGMGAVFEAHHPDGRRAALKLLLPGGAPSERASRFAREGRIGQGLTHPGIVRVLEASEVDGLPYLAMELVEAALPFDRWLAERRPPLPERLAAVRQVAEALHEAHRAGVVHRDLKPQNVLIPPQGRPKVCDFGLAALLDEERLTRSGALLGTPEVMAPEQVRGQRDRIGPATDVWALGMLLWRALVGPTPFAGDGGGSALWAVLHAPLPDPAKARPDLLPGAAEVLRLALERAPERRYPGANLFARDLALLAEGRPRATLAWRRAHRWRRAAPVGVGLLLLLGLVGAALAARAPGAGSDPAGDPARREALRAEAEGLLRAAGRPLQEDAAALAALSSAVAELSPPEPGLREASALLAGVLACARGEREAARAARLALPPGEGHAPWRRALAAGLDLLEGGAPAEAAATLRAVRGSLPRPEVELLLARAIAWDDGASAGALEEGLRAARDLGQPGGALRAWLLARLGRPGEALDELGPLLTAPAAGPDLAPATLAAVAALWESARGDQALELARRAERARAVALAGARGAARLAARLEAQLGERLGHDGPLGEAGRARVREELLLWRCLLPAAPLPEPLGEACLRHATDLSEADVELVLTLAEVAPDDLRVLRAAAAASERRDTPDLLRYLPALRAGFARCPDPELRGEVGSSLVRALVALGEGDEALARGAELLPDLGDRGLRAGVLQALGEVHIARGDPAAALPFLERACADGPGLPYARYLRGGVHRELGHPAEALSDMQAYVVMYGSSTTSASRDDAAVACWELARQLGEPARAREPLEVLAQLHPEWRGWQARLALLQLDAGADPRAALDRALAPPEHGDPAELPPQVAAAREALRAGAPELARPLLAAGVALLEVRRGRGRTP